MTRASRWLTDLRVRRALEARPALVAAALAAITLIGWTAFEVVPRYGVERHRHEGSGRLDHPSFLIGDCVYYRATLVSLLEDRDLDVQNNIIGQPITGYGVYVSSSAGSVNVIDNLVTTFIF